MAATSVKILVTSAVVLSFAASFAGGAEAGRRHKKRLQVSQYGLSYAGFYGYRYRDGGGYYEQRLEALPLGSQQWWSVYDRERGGHR